MTEIMTNDTSQTDPLKTPSGHEAQQNGQPTTPIAGIDEAALTGSARASKLIGSKVYKGDTSIGQIEDVLVDLRLWHFNSIHPFAGRRRPPRYREKTCCCAGELNQGWQRGKLHDRPYRSSACQCARVRLWSR